jgi:hypothetical protein
LAATRTKVPSVPESPSFPAKKSLGKQEGEKADDSEKNQTRIAIALKMTENNQFVCQKIESREGMKWVRA